MSEGLHTFALWCLCLLVGTGTGAGIGGIGALVTIPFGNSSYWTPVLIGGMIGLVTFAALGIIFSPSREKRIRDEGMLEAEHVFEK
jgi:hypothetical protein